MSVGPGKSWRFVLPLPNKPVPLMGSMCGDSVSLWLLLLRIEGIFMGSKWLLWGGRYSPRRGEDQDPHAQMMK
jgi:hypothetical protein